MANICCDDVVFYADNNPDGLQCLWADLESAIVICPDADSGIRNLFQFKGIDISDIGLRGAVTYMEDTGDGILVELETAWSPLYEAYSAIADSYGVSFVLKSIEPGCSLYYNTDISGVYFPEKYIISIEDESYKTPSGIMVSEKLEDDDVFETDQDLLEVFAALGYRAESVDVLSVMLQDTEITIHTFTNPYLSEMAA